MKAFNYPVFDITLCLLTGIMLYNSIEPGLEICLFLTGFSLILGLFGQLSVLRSQKLVFSALLYTHFIALGLLVSALQNPLEAKDHYSHYKNQKVDCVIAITKKLRPTSFAERYEGEMEAVNTEEASGKILINIPYDSTNTAFGNTLQVDDRIAVSTKLQQVREPRNPYQFNYSAYLKKQGIYRQVFLNFEEIFRLPSGSVSARGLAFQLRKDFKNKLQKQAFEAREWGVINALLLGQRQELSSTIRDRYAAAGVIHILAVSGLHVGIVLFILQILLQPLGNRPKIRFFRSLLCIVGIWCFALLTGLSASVLRAATMFSFLQLGLSSSHKSGGMNSLVASAFFLLLLDPSLLYQVGFQLSYAAVFFILWLQPVFFRIWHPKNRVLRYFWGILSVSFCAQLGVLPLSLFYFHQLPLLFLFTNLVVIPFLFIVLSLGFVLLILSNFNLNIQAFTAFYADLVQLMNDFIVWTAGFENFVWKHIYFNLGFVLLTYLTIMGAGLLLRSFTYKRLLVSLTLCLSLVLFSIYDLWKTPSHDLYILYKNRSSLLLEQKADLLKVYKAEKDSLQTQSNAVNDFLAQRHIKKVHRSNLPNYFMVEGKEILIIDKDAIYNIPDIDPDYILLRQSPTINLNRLIQHYPKATFIADASNYKTYVSRWENTCLQQEIPFHSIYKKGFYKIE